MSFSTSLIVSSGVVTKAQSSLPRGFLNVQRVKNPPVMQETQEMRVPSLGWEDPPGGGNGNPLQYSCLKNSIDRGAWWAMVHEVAKSWTYTTECTYTHTAHTFSILEKVNKTIYKNYL